MLPLPPLLEMAGMLFAVMVKLCTGSDPARVNEFGPELLRTEGRKICVCLKVVGDEVEMSVGKLLPFNLRTF